VSGTVASPEGITNPPIDELLDKTSSKYALVIFAAKRARQINAYYAQLNEGLLENVGPLVEARNQEKPLSIAMREINAGLLTAQPAAEPVDVPFAIGADQVAGEEPSASAHVVGDEIV
jgi:DNA-directed RNA polymerase subunit omega